MKVPWITSNQADRLWLAARKLQNELANLDGGDLLPESEDLTTAMAALDQVMSEIKVEDNK